MGRCRDLALRGWAPFALQDGTSRRCCDPCADNYGGRSNHRGTVFANLTDNDLLLVARRSGQGQNPLRKVELDDARTSQGIAAWALVSSTFLIPATILVLVYPNVVAP